MGACNNASINPIPSTVLKVLEREKALGGGVGWSEPTRAQLWMEAGVLKKKKDPEKLLLLVYRLVSIY